MVRNKKWGKKERNVLTAMALMGELILVHRHVKLKEDLEESAVTGLEVPKANRRTKFGGFVGRFAKFRETRPNLNW